MEAVEKIYPKSRQEWRKWLQQNHGLKQAVWLVYFKKSSGMQTLTYTDAVEEALCFGWIDSKAKPVDEEKYMQFFSRRKTNSFWSGINKEKVKQLIDNKLMTKAGFDAIEKAKQNGSWSILDDVEALIIPQDLDNEFTKKPGAKKYFLAFSRSDKRAILQWLVLAKRQETRQNRITEIAALAEQGLKPKQFR